MKKAILLTALIAISLQGRLFAQTPKETPYIQQMRKSKTEQTFNVNSGMINLRDFVVLKEGRLILDLCYLADYENFRNLDSILVNFRKDISFYKDSLDANPTGSVRIDYVLNEDYSFKKIRFKRYNADGSIFLNKDGAISKLKFDQDTVRIIIQKSRPGIGLHNKPGSCMIAYSIQATFILGNYYDIDKVIADNILSHVIDTLAKESTSKRTRKILPDPLTIMYNPYYSGKAVVKMAMLADNEHYLGRMPSSRYLSLTARIGIGLIRNTVTPMGEIGVQYNRYWRPGNYNDHNVFKLTATPYFFFDKNSRGDFLIRDNWFINASAGEIDENPQYGWFGNTATFGVGYLAVNKGDYFKKTTFKVFTDIVFVKGFTIVPEIIFTDNFKQVFPGITLKVF
jgi:hypothetical protein